ncbi:MAG: PAS domain-containing protein [Deltaproteobacteria bacterium]|nr:PAS domain-containing protein [Deltaproteobacteria bacterium]
MKIRWTGLALFVLFLFGIASFTRLLIEYDQKNRVQDILNKGNYLASLIALHPLSEFDGERRDLFLRTLTEYVTCEGLAYCMIHDQTGRSLFTLAPRELVSKIPTDIQTKSLYTMGLTNQTFKVSGPENTIYEFAKPIFEGGQRAGTVRLGFKVPPISFLSMERISLLAMIAFLMFATVTFVYYGMTLSLRSLRKRCQSFDDACTSLVPALPNSGKIGGIIDIIKDIEQSFLQLRNSLNKTETDNVEMAARLGVATLEKNQIYRIIDSINFGIIATDIQDNINYINAYMLNLLYITREKAIDRPLGEVLKNDEVMSFISQQETLKSSNSGGHIDTTFPDLSPGEIFQVTSFYMRDDEGSVIGKMISIKNITNEKASEMARDEFIANVAHEFLTPLTTIKSYNEMLMDNEVEDREMQKDFFNTISEETTRLSRLIQNLLNISKIEMGSLTLSSGLVKTDWLMNDPIAAVEKAAQKKNIIIEKNMPDNFPSLVGDKELLKTSMINLLGNAVKYSPENSRISFSLTNQKDMIVFDVIDTGYGISENDLPHIFDKFYRADDPQIREQAGTGLGLAMTSQIIQLHGGEIEVQSELGEGTHFTIRFPVEDYQLAKQ